MTAPGETCLPETCWVVLWRTTLSSARELARRRGRRFYAPRLAVSRGKFGNPEAWLIVDRMQAIPVEASLVLVQLAGAIGVTVASGFGSLLKPIEVSWADHARRQHPFGKAPRSVVAVETAYAAVCEQAADHFHPATDGRSGECRQVPSPYIPTSSATATRLGFGRGGTGGPRRWPVMCG